MPRIQHRFEFPDRFVAGTVGEPGDRTFFVQARQGSRLVSVVCEKQQVEVLAEHLERILDELAQLAQGVVDIPPQRQRAADLEPLDAPLEEDFRVGTMTIAWDGSLEAVQVELFSVETEADPTVQIPGLDEESLEELEGLEDVLSATESLTVAITTDQARDFSARARALVHAGRPASP
ncbi:DUF3090 domain-containing protein, partial [Luteococcus sp. Sow4_B9]|uniref:DUF3090 domain-containing protein n=1 Tax=Luteococcus sp. Sow4_B9 TaxID=3438792 RepID=UPI003F954103